MDGDELEQVGRAYKRAKQKSDALHEDLKRVIVAAYKQDVGTMVIADRTGHPRELVRRILLAAEKAGEITMRRPAKK